MSDAVLKIDVHSWVERAKADMATYRQRQVTEITLNAIAMSVPLKDRLYLKGGILMGLAYDSPRQTADIDLTADFIAKDETGAEISGLIDAELPRAATNLGYPDLVVRTSSVKGLPKRYYPDADFPALKMKIAYAERGSRQEGALLAGKAVSTIDIDISFNESTSIIQVLELTGGQELHAYSLVDLIAEKYRAVLQQVERNRYRRQDVYDLDLLIQLPDIGAEMRQTILDVFIGKCRSRGIEPTQESIDDPEVKRRSAAEWDTLKLELGEIPEFESCYEQVALFYRDLPWIDP